MRREEGKRGQKKATRRDKKPGETGEEGEGRTNDVEVREEEGDGCVDS